MKMSYFAQLYGLERMEILQQVEPRLPTTEPVSYMEVVSVPLVDNRGIPLSSDRAPKELIQDLDFEYKPCPFRDSPSRYPDGQPHEIPVSGLEQRRLVEHYDMALGLAAGVRQRLFPDKGSASLSNYETIQVLQSLKWLPHYLAFRGGSQYNTGRLHPGVVITSNCAAGTLGGLYAGLEDRAQVENEAVGLPPEAAQMIAASEKRGTMIGENTVCAASPRMMKKFIEATSNTGDVKVQDESEDVTEILETVHLGKLRLFVDSVLMAEHIVSGIPPFTEHSQREATELRSQMQATRNSRKKARIRGVQLAKITKEFDSLKKMYEQEYQAAAKTLLNCEIRINWALDRKPPTGISLEMPDL